MTIMNSNKRVSAEDEEYINNIQISLTENKLDVYYFNPYTEEEQRIDTLDLPIDNFVSNVTVVNNPAGKPAGKYLKISFINTDIADIFVATEDIGRLYESGDAYIKINDNKITVDLSDFYNKSTTDNKLDKKANKSYSLIEKKPSECTSSDIMVDIKCLDNDETGGYQINGTNSIGGGVGICTYSDGGNFSLFGGIYLGNDNSYFTGASVFSGGNISKIDNVFSIIVRGPQTYDLIDAQKSVVRSGKKSNKIYGTNSRGYDVLYDKSNLQTTLPTSIIHYKDTPPISSPDYNDLNLYTKPGFFRVSSYAPENPRNFPSGFPTDLTANLIVFYPHENGAGANCWGLTQILASVGSVWNGSSISTNAGLVYTRPIWYSSGWKFGPWEKLTGKVDKTTQTNKIYGTDSSGNQKLYNTTDFGKTYTAGSGIDITNDVISNTLAPLEVIEIVDMNHPANFTFNNMPFEKIVIPDSHFNDFELKLHCYVYHREGMNGSIGTFTLLYQENIFIIQDDISFNHGFDSDTRTVTKNDIIKLILGGSEPTEKDLSQFSLTIIENDLMDMANQGIEIHSKVNMVDLLCKIDNMITFES